MSTVTNVNTNLRENQHTMVSLPQSHQQFIQQNQFSATHNNTFNFISVTDAIATITMISTFKQEWMVGAFFQFNNNI
jgi:hypothetical protein